MTLLESVAIFTESIQKEMQEKGQIYRNAARVRAGEEADVPRLMEVFRQAREIMRADGNATQWAGEYPSREVVLEDIRLGRCFVVEDEAGATVGTFAFVEGVEPTYARIYGGVWLDDTLPYATIHRLASTRDSRGVAAACFAWARRRSPNLRVDTHADNRIMQHCIEKAGFTYCGIIYLADGAPRLAYQKLRSI